MYAYTAIIPPGQPSYRGPLATIIKAGWVRPLATIIDAVIFKVSPVPFPHFMGCNELIHYRERESNSVLVTLKY